MSITVWWLVAAVALLVAEMLTGTFYLLVISIALAVAAVASFVGLPVAAQLLIAAAVGIGGSMWLQKRRRATPAEESSALQNLDVGQSIHVDAWKDDRTTRASYRGAMWDVTLAEGEQPARGEFVIREIHANRLVVAPRHAA